MSKKHIETSNKILDDFDIELSEIIKNGKSDEELHNKFNKVLESNYHKQVYMNILVWCGFVESLPITKHIKRTLKEKYFGKN